MTVDEKNIMKEMNRMLCKLAYEKAVCEGALKKNVTNWDEELRKANGDLAYQRLQQDILKTQELAELLIDNDDPTGFLAKVKSGPVN